jgi:sphinganine-1-phosphate aldolase
VSTGWPGGVYASPSIAGSRPGALLAGAWAAMLFMGRQGYLESCKQIVGAARQIVAGIRENIPELEILGDPKSTVVAFQSETLDVYAVGDKMSERGWHRKCFRDIRSSFSMLILPCD